MIFKILMPKSLCSTILWIQLKFQMSLTFLNILYSHYNFFCCHKFVIAASRFLFGGKKKLTSKCIGIFVSYLLINEIKSHVVQLILLWS